MLKLIILGIIGYVIYKMFFNQKITPTPTNDSDDNELIECSNCHTFVPKSECRWNNNRCLCKECQ